jgi:hypothetical protein
MAGRTQEALYSEIDLELSWSEAELPQVERTKHVHGLHPYLGKYVPEDVDGLEALERPARGDALGHVRLDVTRKESVDAVHAQQVDDGGVGGLARTARELTLARTEDLPGGPTPAEALASNDVAQLYLLLGKSRH